MSVPANAEATSANANANAAADADPPSGAGHNGLGALTLGAIGVVYGDIGTSPLYTMKEVFGPHTGATLDARNLIGAVSVIFWALMLVVTLKYVILILRADNRGEGGGLALTALASAAVRSQPRLRNALLLLGVFGATLFYGDSVITPAISVLGAMEGLKLIAPASESYVVPLSLAVLVALFAVQSRGTAFVGRFFGPIIVTWFVALGISGVVQIAQTPAILAALNPVHAVAFLSERGAMVLVALGAIVLALTGAEALYADMGHFGRRPIQLAWGALVLPSLALNYMGQGALLMANPGAIENPFYRMFPESLLVPALVLATLAAVIASQAVISGAYSMTRQAIQLGFLPRMAVRFTSASEAGQIYMPAVNWALLAGVLASVVAFGSSSNLAAAYGMAVTLTMLITTILTYFVVRNSWGLPAPVAIGATLFFLALDALWVAGSAVKLLDGGWFPLALGFVIFALMTTWWHGRRVLLERLREDGLALQPFIDSLHEDDMHGVRRVDRTAIYPVADASMVPQALLHNLKHYQVLHQRNVILHVQFAERPTVPAARRAAVRSLGHGFWSITLTFGFMDTPDVPLALEQMQADGAAAGAATSAEGGATADAADAAAALPPLPLQHFTRFETSYFLSRETMVPTHGTGLANWRERAFATMSRNASGVVEFFHLPDNAVVELGTRVQV